MSHHAPPNKFRATILNGPDPLLASQKKSRIDRSADGLNAVKIARTESRRANQRGNDRHRLDARRAVVRRRQKEHSVELVNLSSGGAMVSGSFHAEMWETVELVLGEFGSVECAVRWVRGDRYGLEFAHETRINSDADVQDQVFRDVLRNCFPEVKPSEGVAAEESTPELDQMRKARRHPLIWKGIVHHAYDWEVMRVRNISAGGAMIECSSSLPEGVTVFLELDRIGRIRGTVCWSMGGQAGVSFEEPFDVLRLGAAEPEVAPAQWAKPDYLKDIEESPSPWADQWGRLTLGELRYTLRG